MKAWPKRIPLSLFAVALGVTAVSCARLQEPPLPAAAAPVSSTHAAGAKGPSAPAVASTDAQDLNRKLLSQLTPPAEERDLPLGPGDLIAVSVFDVPEFSNLRLRIPLSGSVTLPLIGAIPAAGLTPGDIENEIRTRLQRDYMHDPQVSVFVEEQKSQRISVLGAVKTGGVYTLGGRIRLADALAMAGGLAEDAGHTVYIIRHAPAEAATSARADGVTADAAAAAGGKAQEVMTAVDVEALAEGKNELNLPLQSGDVIDVPRAGSYYVGGEVQRPGSFLLKTQTTLEQAIVTAGGVKDVADWDDVRLYRTGAGGKRDVLTFSMDDFEKGKPAPFLREEDVIVVGRSGVKTLIYAVRDFIRFGVGATVPIP